MIQKSIGVIADSGERLTLLSFQANLNVNLRNENTTESHRSYYEQEEAFLVDTDGCQWKYSQLIKNEPKEPTPKGTSAVTKIKTSNKHGRNNNDPSDYVRGISMWDIHCIPQVIVDKMKQYSINKEIKCTKLIIDYNNQLPIEFELYNDEKYTVDINGITTTFIHRLLTPSDIYTSEELADAVIRIVSEDCTLGGAIDSEFDKTFKDFPDENCGFEVTVGQEYAIQHCLYSLVCDNEAELSQRIDAFILCAWIGTFDSNIKMIVNHSKWAANFMLNCFAKYPSMKDMSSSLLVNYDDAERILKYLLGVNNNMVS